MNSISKIWNATGVVIICIEWVKYFRPINMGAFSSRHRRLWLGFSLIMILTATASTCCEPAILLKR